VSGISDDLELCLQSLHLAVQPHDRSLNHYSNLHLAATKLARSQPDHTYQPTDRAGPDPDEDGFDGAIKLSMALEAGRIQQNPAAVIVGPDETLAKIIQTKEPGNDTSC
jgi:hypothetical protein